MNPTSGVLALITDMFARWNSKDAASFSEVFSDDADFTDVIGQTARGKGAIETQHRFPFTRNMREATLAADSVDVRPLGADAAVALVKWTTAGNLSLDGAPIPPRKGTMQVVVQRDGGAFRVVSVLNQDPLGTYGKHVAERGGLPPGS